MLPSPFRNGIVLLYEPDVTDVLVHTYYSEKAVGAGRAVYVKRNYDMIDNSPFCVIYCRENSLPENRKSGTKLALSYAVKQKKSVILLR